MSKKNRLPDHADVLIAGAGPAGLAAALDLSRAHVNVVLVDSREHIGYPLRCGEITGMDYFRTLNVRPRRRWIRQRLRERKGIIILDREKCENDIAMMALKQGALVAPGTSVAAVGRFDGLGRRVTLQSKKGRRDIHVGCILAADGVSSSVARFAGIDTYISPNNIATGLAYRLVGVTLKKPHKIHIEPLPYPYPVFPCYFWVIPNGHNQAQVGLGIPGITGFEARSVLHKMMAETNAYKGGRIVQTIVGLIPDVPPLEKPFKDGIMVMGGAARMINPMSSGGIGPAAQSGRAAAKTYRDTKGAPATEAMLSSYRRLINPIYKKLHDQWKTRRNVIEDYKKGLPVRVTVGRKWVEE